VVIGEPELGVGLTAIFGEVGWLAKPGWKLSIADGSTEDSRARWFRRRTAVLSAIVAAAPMWMVASGGPLAVVASSSADHLVVTLRLASVIEAVVDRGDPIDCRHPSRLGMNRGLPILPMWCWGEVRDGTTPPRGGTLGLLHRGGLEEIPELAANPSPLHGRGLEHRTN